MIKQIQKSKEEFDKKFPREVYHFRNLKKKDEFNDTPAEEFEAKKIKDFITKQQIALLEEVKKEIEKWEYQYTNYTTQMNGETAFKRGKMAKELSKDLIDYIDKSIKESK